MADMEPGAPPATECDCPQGSGTKAVFVWDASAGDVPIARGWNAEPCIVDWDGTGQPRFWSPPKEALRGDRSGCIVRLPPRNRACHRAMTRGRACLRFKACAPSARFPMSVPAVSICWRFARPDWFTFPTREHRMSLPLVLESFSCQREPGNRSCRGRWDDSRRLGLRRPVRPASGRPRPGGLLARRGSASPHAGGGAESGAGHPGYDRHGLWRGRAPEGRVFGSAMSAVAASLGSSSSPSSREKPARSISVCARPRWRSPGVGGATLNSWSPTSGGSCGFIAISAVSGRRC